LDLLQANFQGFLIIQNTYRGDVFRNWRGDLLQVGAQNIETNSNLIAKAIILRWKLQKKQSEYATNSYIDYRD